MNPFFLRLIKAIGFVVVLFFFQSCSSYSHLKSEYHELLRKQQDKHEGARAAGLPNSLESVNEPAPPNRTVLFFLIDGLPLSTLQQQLDQNNLPHIKKYFLSAGSEGVARARTAFPSLTFPGVGSLLMERAVDQHGIYGNKILSNKTIVDFELPASSALLNKISKGRNIYARLKTKGLRTVNIDYNFSSDADVSMRADDAEIGIAILKKKYEVIDKKLLGSLRELLDETATEQWPDFIFIHLVGLDFKSHDHGPQSEEALDYLKFLDKKMGDVFKTLDFAEKGDGRQIIALLSSDHGFDQDVQSFLNLEEVINKLDRQIQILNEGRYLGLFFPDRWTTEERITAFQDIAHHPQIEMVVSRIQDQLDIQTSKGSQRIPLVEANDEKYQKLFHPFLAGNLGHYFNYQGHPDAIIISRPGVSFQHQYLGQHGGPTEQETMVPLLLHNAVVTDAKNIPALWELLQFL